MSTRENIRLIARTTLHYKLTKKHQEGETFINCTMFSFKLMTIGKLPSACFPLFLVPKQSVSTLFVKNHV